MKNQTQTSMIKNCSEPKKSSSDRALYDGQQQQHKHHTHQLLLGSFRGSAKNSFEAISLSAKLLQLLLQAEKEEVAALVPRALDIYEPCCFLQNVPPEVNHYLLPLLFGKEAIVCNARCTVHSAGGNLSLILNKKANKQRIR